MVEWVDEKNVIIDIYKTAVGGTDVKSDFIDSHDGKVVDEKEVVLIVDSCLKFKQFPRCKKIYFLRVD